MKKNFFDIISALLTISILAFIFIQLTPGEPAENYLRASHLPITDELLKQKRRYSKLNTFFFILIIFWSINFWLI